MRLSDANILEIGCGSGANLWFAAREGAEVFGLDFSRSAIAYARQRFESDGLSGSFAVANLPEIPNFEVSSFDFIIDRSCLTHCSHSVITKTLQRLQEQIHPDGYFFSTVYGKAHTSCGSGKPKGDGLTADISKGALRDVGPVAFFDSGVISDLWSTCWEIEILLHRRDAIHAGKEIDLLSEWHITASPLNSATNSASTGIGEYAG